MKITMDKDNVNYVRSYCEQTTGYWMRKKPIHENLWSFLESTDFAYQVVTGQGTSKKLCYLFNHRLLLFI